MMISTRYLHLIIILFLSAAARADAGDNTDLKKIMQDLRNDAVMILDALLIDDFDSAIGASSRIADHPQIPASQVSLVAAELGPEMAVFKQFDNRVHDLSSSINSAAREKDRSQAIADYQQMVNECIACHTLFRDRIAVVLTPATVGK